MFVIVACPVPIVAAFQPVSVPWLAGVAFKMLIVFVPLTATEAVKPL
jgi:hypothetical protein